MTGEGETSRDVGPQAIRALKPGRLVIASHNAGKVREIRELLGPYGIEPVSAAELDLPEPEETGTTFVANAELKALQAADLSGLPALADDSGLCVEALNNEPGIFSARWAGESKDFGFAMRLVEERLAALPPETSRDAHFVCALALAWPDGHVEWFEGRVDGTLVWPPRGDQGFGYDPMFVPAGHAQSFGEMEPAAKHAMSHRADAFRQLVAAVLGQER
ncbi:MAG: RdgB/HAM1 family non-canonical purine NTP pyrophosphatase [Sphingomonas sp.]|uniref:RdgB/HAM1 family non-canonical purine NTP pyrophosphatase n=1 Tax=unclassified Sphingomonas TaxID=196159 RepID=UPI0024588008|nr:MULTISPECIES: RdgB/HAM1 family non-canonical purine NTP pyrophosphatase [unclassified Sphingomonas]MBQ1500291.1 RdgB/HAM1 family non-canonical purine NTP pyrophosphatase [Sphingomonas sp.]MDH4744155.1 RdgB/HAM1 family non-canonical purine NTP pyrophosphatase [Sphingomonas sp. CBMAI 2297]